MNYFFDNAANAQESGNNQWYYETQGNWWFDYNEVDKDQDGIGDAPYLIPGGKQDLYPTGKFLRPPLKPTDPDPEDYEDDVGLSVTLRVTVSDPDSETLDVFFYRASDDKLYGEDHNVPNGEEASCKFSLPFETTFLWYAIVTDGKLENRSDIWIFTTRLIPPTNLKPVADPGGPYYAVIGEEITLDGSGSEDPDGDIDFYRWNFGDGSSEILAISPKHIYNDPGTYTVVLTVVDNDGRSDVTITTVTIASSASNNPPTANAGGPYSNKVGKSITFDASNSYDIDGSIVNYTWNFGDGNTTGYGISTTHVYTDEGTFIVTLTTTDDEGSIATVSTDADIDPAPGFPGFEFIIMILAVAFILFLEHKKNK